MFSGTIRKVLWLTSKGHFVDRRGGSSMMSEANEFKVSLSSNVAGNVGNTLSLLKTTLARPLKLSSN